MPIKKCVVTGCANQDGIGSAVVQGLLAQGHSVCMLDRPGTEADLAKQASQFSKQGQQCEWQTCDVTDIDAVRDVMLSLPEVDILVNCAGLGLGSAEFEDCTDADWDLSWQVNVLGIRNLCLGVVPKMRAQASGSIVNISSLAGLGALPGMPACYTASKYAAVGMTKQLALELAASGIRVNAVCPGSVDTQMRSSALSLLAQANQIPLSEAEDLENQMIALGRPATTQEVADLVIFLAGDTASYITGAALEISGGMGKGI